MMRRLSVEGPMATRKKGTVQEVSENELKERLKGKSEERRGGDRLPARLEVDVPLTNWQQVKKVYTTNISKGGLLFSVTSPATMPATVDLTLTLPDGSKVTLSSEVRHVSRRDGSTEFDVGVQFRELDAASRKVFESALAKLDQ
jgi:c-di-GMP-binding flagellar brake protein YcgR